MRSGNLSNVEGEKRKAYGLRRREIATRKIILLGKEEEERVGREEAKPICGVKLQEPNSFFIWEGGRPRCLLDRVREGRNLLCTYEKPFLLLLLLLGGSLRDRRKIVLIKPRRVRTKKLLLPLPHPLLVGGGICQTQLFQYCNYTSK